jgi:exosortase
MLRGVQLQTVGKLVLLVALVGLTFHEFLSWLVYNWQHDDYYSHGPLIPLLSAYLIYRAWPKLRGLPAEGHVYGLWLIAGGLLFQLGSVYYGAHFPSGFALIAVLYGLVIWLWGWPRGRALLFPFAFLFFMVPMARLLVDKFSVPMQLFSAHGAAALGGVFGLVDHTEGVKIFTRDYVFEVAIPCSGLKSIIAMSALGALVAYLLEGPLWKRWILFAASIPVAIIANILRIFVTLVLGNSLGPAAAEGFFHKASGALVFVIAFVGLLVLGGLMGCRQMREDI